MSPPGGTVQGMSLMSVDDKLRKCNVDVASESVNDVYAKISSTVSSTDINNDQTGHNTEGKTQKCETKDSFSLSEGRKK